MEIIAVLLPMLTAIYCLPLPSSPDSLKAFQPIRIVLIDKVNLTAVSEEMADKIIPAPSYSYYIIRHIQDTLDREFNDSKKVTVTKDSPAFHSSNEKSETPTQVLDVTVENLQKELPISAKPDKSDHEPVTENSTAVSASDEVQSSAQIELTTETFVTPVREILSPLDLTSVVRKSTPPGNVRELLSPLDASGGLVAGDNTRPIATVSATEDVTGIFVTEEHTIFNDNETTIDDREQTESSFEGFTTEDSNFGKKSEISTEQGILNNAAQQGSSEMPKGGTKSLIETELGRIRTGAEPTEAKKSGINVTSENLNEATVPPNTTEPITTGITEKAPSIEIIEIYRDDNASDYPDESDEEGILINHGDFGVKIQNSSFRPVIVEDYEESFEESASSEPLAEEATLPAFYDQDLRASRTIHGGGGPFKVRVDSNIPSVSSNKHKFGYVVDDTGSRKYRVEEKTPEGYIVGEYGILNYDSGHLRGVKYAAHGSAHPRLIYEALLKFLSL